MRNIFLVLILVLSGCQSLQYNNAVQVIPVQLHPEFEMPILQLKVNGRAMLAILDSGAYFNACIAENILKEVGAFPLDDKQKSTDVRGVVHLRQLYEADLQIGDVCFGKLKTEIFAPWGYYLVDDKQQDINDFHNSLNMDSVYVGSGLFKNYNILWNLADGEIVLYPFSDTTAVNSNEWISSDFTVTQNGYEFILTTDNHNLLVMIDSGCNASCASNNRQNIFHKKSEGAREKLNDLKFDNLALDQLEVIIMNSSEPSVDILLGCDFLKKYMVFFDMQNNKIWLKKAN